MSLLLSTVPTGVLSAWPLSNRLRLSLAMASEPLVGKVTRTVKLARASAALMRASLNTLVPCSATLKGAFGAVVSPINTKPAVAVLVLPAMSVSVALKL